MNKKLILMAILLLILSSLVVSTASATETLYVYYETHHNSSDIAAVHPSDDTDPSALGQSLTGNGQYLTKAAFLVNKSGAPTGHLRVGLWNNTGGVPDEILENSTTEIVIESLSTGNRVWYEFEFSGDTQLEAFETYYICMYVLDGELLVSENFVVVGSDVVGATGTGYVVTFLSTAWAAGSTSDLCYRFYTSPTSSSESTTVDDAYVDALVLNFTSFFVPILVILLPAAVLCFISRRVDKWLILIGLTIGAGLGYYFSMVPLWLVFLVVIGLIGMAYQSVKGGG